jgi:hypothetical protein
MIAGGTESMSMIPMMGKVSLNPQPFSNVEHVKIAYGMSITDLSYYARDQAAPLYCDLFIQ